MKILMVSNMYPSKKYPYYGVFVKNFEECLKEEHINIDKIVLNKYDSKFQKLIRYIIYYFKIIYCILFRNYDYVYVHYISHNAIPLLITKKLKKYKLWINVHGTDVIPQKKVQYFLHRYVKKILPIADKIIVPSQYYKRFIIDEFSLDNVKIDVVASGGVNNKIFKKIDKDEVNKFKDKIGINLNKTTIGYVGRLENKKGWDIFLEAIYKMKIDNLLYDKQIVVVGNGSKELEFKGMMEELKLKSNIIYINMMSQRELALLYNSLDVLCFTSLQESLGLIPLECMACETFLIASDIEATKEYMFNKKNGLVYKANSSQELYLRIKQFFKLTEKEKEEMIKQAKKISSRYYKERINIKIKNIF